MPNSEPKIELFPTTTVVTPNSSTTVHCEMFGDAFAVTPYLAITDDGGYELGGGFNITHVPTGRKFGENQACIECAREVARRVSALPVDWMSLDISSAETVHAALGEHRAAVGKALRLFGQCAQQCCFHDEEACGACGMTKQHAPYCIYVVGPMVAENNARILANEAAR
jgi:hypothetical protein